MSKIEQIITEIEEYIDGCKFKPLSSSVIMVNKDEIDEMLAELSLTFIILFFCKNCNFK